MLPSTAKPKAVRVGNVSVWRAQRGARMEGLVAAAAADRVKLPGSHIETSRKALEDLKMDGDVNSECIGCLKGIGGIAY